MRRSNPLPFLSAHILLEPTTSSKVSLAQDTSGMMSCRLPLLCPLKYRTSLKALLDRGIPVPVVEFIAVYLWSSTLTFVASRDGYLRILFDESSCVFEEPLGSQAIWCLCYAWSQLYISFWGGRITAFSLSEDFERRQSTATLNTILCLCTNTRVLCGGSDSGCFYVFSPDLVILNQLLLTEAISNPCHLFCCLHFQEAFLVGSSEGSIYRVTEASLGSTCSVEKMRQYTDNVFCLKFSNDETLLFAGLDSGVDVLSPTTMTSLYTYGTNDSVWSISPFGTDGIDGIVIGTAGGGIQLLQLDTAIIKRQRSPLYPFATSHTLLLHMAAIGTCSAISKTISGSFYLASNNSRIYCMRFGQAREITMYERPIALPVHEPEDASRIPRRDIYDVLSVPKLVLTVPTQVTRCTNTHCRSATLPLSRPSMWCRCCGHNQVALTALPVTPVRLHLIPPGIHY